MYKLLYHPRSLKFFKKLPLKEKNSLLTKLEKLQEDPFTKTLDNITKLATTKRTFRLRAGTTRVVYEVEPKTKIVYVHDIDFRGNIY